MALFLLVVHLEDWARGLALLVEFKTSQVNEKDLEKNDEESERNLETNLRS